MHDFQAAADEVEFADLRG